LRSFGRIRREPGGLSLAAFVCMFAALAWVWGQQAAMAQSAGPAPAPSRAAGGELHGTVKSGSTPLPGVAVTATNTLTGKRYATTTDITGAWSMRIPQNGRYVLRTEFAAFAASTHEALLNASSQD